MSPCEFVMGFFLPCSNQDAVCDPERRGQFRRVSPSSGVVMNAMFFVHASLVAVVEQGAGHRSWGGGIAPVPQRQVRTANVSAGRWEGNSI